MIAPIRPSQPSVADWHRAFIDMLPKIRRQTELAFRHGGAEAKEELVSEVVANVYCAFARLVERGLPHLAFPTALTRFAIRQIRCGRRIGSRSNAKDLSSHRRRPAAVRIHSLDHFDPENRAWQEALVEHRHAGPADTAAARIDIAQWLARLPDDKRQFVEALSRGEERPNLMRLFGISSSRISQLRRELRQSWETFHAGRSTQPRASCRPAHEPTTGSTSSRQEEDGCSDAFHGCECVCTTEGYHASF